MKKVLGLITVIALVLIVAFDLTANNKLGASVGSFKFNSHVTNVQAGRYTSNSVSNIKNHTEHYRNK